VARPSSEPPRDRRTGQAHHRRELCSPSAHGAHARLQPPTPTWRVSAAVGRAHLLGDLDRIAAGELAGPIATSGARRGLSLRQLQERCRSKTRCAELDPGQPRAVARTPGAGGVLVAHVAAQQQLALPLARAHQIAAQVLPRPDQVAQCLLLAVWDPDRVACRASIVSSRSTRSASRWSSRSGSARAARSRPPPPRYSRFPRVQDVGRLRDESAYARFNRDKTVSVDVEFAPARDEVQAPGPAAA
jgi:hypothetical protein